MNKSRFENRSLQDADALIIALKSRRFVIVHQDSPARMYADPICKRLRDLSPGDTVFYQGQPDVVCALSAY